MVIHFNTFFKKYIFCLNIFFLQIKKKIKIIKKKKKKKKLLIIIIFFFFFEKKIFKQNIHFLKNVLKCITINSRIVCIVIMTFF